MKKIMAVTIFSGLMMLAPLGSGVLVMAQEAPQARSVDAGNKICPVMGNAVSATVTVEYQGKVYHLCCPMCAKMFLQDPEKYKKIAEEEIASQGVK